MIEGHCDDVGSNEYNLALGERRAKAVLNYLVSLGANPDQFIVVSKGEESPAQQGTDRVSRMLNRRAAFTLP